MAEPRDLCYTPIDNTRRGKRRPRAAGARIEPDQRGRIRMFWKYYGKLLAQLALDYNCVPEDLEAKENVVTVSRLREGRRSYTREVPFLQMVTTGGNTVVMADERLHGFLREFVSGAEGHRLFEHGKLSELDAELNKYGYRMAPTHHMFLPCRDVKPKGEWRAEWFDEDGIRPFYGDKRFPNAISYPEPCPARPDRLAVAAFDGDVIMGMAGCSEDAPHWQQIGIDVLPRYRSMGLGACLVTMLKNRIIETGDVPFYGTASANIRSQNIALNSGFRPAWVETEAHRIGE